MIDRLGITDEREKEDKLEKSAKVGRDCRYYGTSACAEMAWQGVFCTETRLKVCNLDRENYLKGGANEAEEKEGAAPFYPDCCPKDGC